MKRLRGLLRLILLLPLLLPAQSFAVTDMPETTIMIAEFQTTGTGNATNEEFVEIYNSGEDAVDISDWKLQYSSASSTSWQNKATLNGILQPKMRILLASTDYLSDISDINFTPGFKMESGHIRLVSPDPVDANAYFIEDLVGWGTAVYPETLPADYAPAGNSLERVKDEEGEYIDSDNNKLDFMKITSPTPESTNFDVVEEPSGTELPESELTDEEESEIPTESVETEEPLEEFTEEPAQEEIVDTTVEEKPIFVVDIRELMPNPAPPLSDSEDEFIELYNPNSFPVDLAGYKLQSGNSFSYSYEFDQTIIGPNSYLTLYISETGLILSNTSGKARLLGTDGDVVSETDPYADAKEGESWALVNGVWQWTIQPTPGANNQFVPPLLASAKKVKKTKIKAAKKAKKKATTKKKAAKKTKKSKRAKEAQALGLTTDEDPGGGSSLHPFVIATMGTLALGYAVYEYKDDVANKLRQLRVNRELRRKTRRPA